MTTDVVWLHDERLYAEVLSMHAHYAIVKFHQHGHEYNIIVEHEDYDIIEGEAGDDAEDSDQY